MRSARARRTAGLAWNAPSTVTDSDGGTRQLGRHVAGNACQSDDLNMEWLACSHHRLEVGAAVVLKAHRERPASHGLLDRVGMQGQLVSNRRSHQV